MSLPLLTAAGPRAVPPPVGCRIRCCNATGCRAVGAEAVLHELQRHGAQGGWSGPEPLTIKPVGCLLLCGRGPLLACDRQGEAALLGGLRPDQVPQLLAQLAAWGPATAAADPLAPWRLDPQQPFFRLQYPVVLEGCGLVDPTSIDDAMAHGAYQQLQRLLWLGPTAVQRTQVRREIRRSGLRGRGGAAYPTGLKWDRVALQSQGSPAHGSPVVVCNADEGDPGAFMDRSVLEGDPHRLLEGLAIAAYAVGAQQAWVYVRAEYPLAIARLRRAIRQARHRRCLGAAVAGTDWSLQVQVRVGAGAYVCGEETALLQSIQGRRGLPRPRPPYPAERGLGGRPTLINNVETLAAVPAILRRGATWYASLGQGRSRGTKVFSLSGAIRHTGLVEVPMGTSLRTVVHTIGGGGAAGQPIKAVQTGGPSGGCLPAALLDTPVDDDSLRALGSLLGSGGLVVVGASTAMPELSRYFMRFCVQESCGKCVPCRAGTVQLLQLLDRIVQGRGQRRDLQLLEQLCQMVQATSLCGLGQAAPNPVLSTLRHFRAEYTALLVEAPS